MPAKDKIRRNHAVRKDPDNGRPSRNRNKGSGLLSLIVKYDNSDWTAHSGYVPLLMCTKHPFRNGSVLHALILMRKQEGDELESTAVSATLRWRDGE